MLKKKILKKKTGLFIMYDYKQNKNKNTTLKFFVQLTTLTSSSFGFE